MPRAVDELLGEPSIRTIAIAWTVPDDVKPNARRLRGQRPGELDERRFLELPNGTASCC